MLLASAPAHSTFHQGTAHALVSAGLAKSLLSLEEDVLTAGLRQGLKYWSLSRSQRRPLQIIADSDATRHAVRLCPTRVRLSSRGPNFFQVPYSVSVSVDCFGDESATSPGHKPHASMTNGVSRWKGRRGVQHRNSVWCHDGHGRVVFAARDASDDRGALNKRSMSSSSGRALWC